MAAETTDKKLTMNWRKKLLKLVEPELEKLDVAHQVGHSFRVYKNCEEIARGYKNVNLKVLYAASLLHDIGQIINKYNEHSHDSIELAEKFLEKVGFPKDNYELVREAIKKHDDYIWVSKHSSIKPKSLEARIFQDADRIESMGAIGIIRQFLFAGKHGKKIYDHNKKSRPDLIYGGNISAIHTIRDHEMKIYKHFNTSAAKKIAKGRHEFMEEFLKQFFKEWKQ